MNSNQRITESSQLKQQVLGDIQKVKDDFNEIRNRLTPGQIIDEAIYYNRGAGAPADTFTYLKDNPVGTAFLTLGTLLLMEDKEHHSYEYVARGKYSDMKDQASITSGKIQSAVSDVKAKAAQIKNKVTSKLSRKKEEIAGFEGMGVESSIPESKSKFSDMASKAKQRFSGVSDSVKTKGHDLYESSKNLDPLTYLALGAGLGTITGASIPVSGTESEFFDSKFEGKFSTFSQELQDALNQSVNILKNEFIGGMTDIKLDLF